MRGPTASLVASVPPRQCGSDRTSFEMQHQAGMMSSAYFGGQRRGNGESVRYEASASKAYQFQLRSQLRCVRVASMRIQCLKRRASADHE